MKKIAEVDKISEEQKLQFFVEYGKRNCRVVDNGIKLIAYDMIDKTQEEVDRETFNRLFFSTSLGYVSRVVHFKDGHIENFLADVLPSLKVGVPIITYNTDRTQNLNVMVTEQFLQECAQQRLSDFYG